MRRNQFSEVYKSEMNKPLRMVNSSEKHETVSKEHLQNKVQRSLDQDYDTSQVGPGSYDTQSTFSKREPFKNKNSLYGRTQPAYTFGSKSGFS